MNASTATWTTPSNASGRELREAARGNGPLAECARRELARREESEARLAALLGWNR